MTQPRNHHDHAQVERERTDRGQASPRGGPEAAAAGRTAYREEFQRDHGPDLDEPQDVTESGHEF